MMEDRLVVLLLPFTCLVAAILELGMKAKEKPKEEADGWRQTTRRRGATRRKKIIISFEE